MRLLNFTLLISITFFVTTLGFSSPRDFSVYNVASSIPMGTPGEVRLKDYYVNMGSNQGLKKGDFLEALRRLPSYDLMDQEFSRDLIFPIAVLKVIHVQSNAAICRLEKMLPLQSTPSISPLSVMVGDYIRVLGSQEIPQILPEKDTPIQAHSAAETQPKREDSKKVEQLSKRADSTSAIPDIKKVDQRIESQETSQVVSPGEKLIEQKKNIPTADLVSLTQ